MQVRKLESVSYIYSTEVVNLDPEKFRNCSRPYEGNSDEEFLSYLDKIGYDLDSLLEEVDEETADELVKLLDTPHREIWNSTLKGEKSWYESGKCVEGKVKNGGFETEHSTDDSW